MRLAAKQHRDESYWDTLLTLSKKHQKQACTDSTGPATLCACCHAVLQGVQYGVFGLGNKQYEHFNAVGKRMHKNMEALGATPVCPRGDGDDDDNIGGCSAAAAAAAAGVCWCLPCVHVDVHVDVQAAAPRRKQLL
jgi:hypothetical protein